MQKTKFCELKKIPIAVIISIANLIRGLNYVKKVETIIKCIWCVKVS